LLRASIEAYRDESSCEFKAEQRKRVGVALHQNFR
jgi:hypothetical protein